jgi:hypothetical protein
VGKKRCKFFKKKFAGIKSLRIFAAPKTKEVLGIIKKNKWS